MVEDGEQVRNVGGQSERPADSGALPPAPQVRGEDSDGVTEVAGDAGPRPVRTGDPVDGQDDGDARGAGLRPGHADVQRAAGKRYGEGGVKRLRHADQPVTRA